MENTSVLKEMQILAEDNSIENKSNSSDSSNINVAVTNNDNTDKTVSINDEAPSVITELSGKDVSEDHANPSKIDDRNPFTFKNDKKIGISDIKALLDDDFDEEKPFAKKRTFEEKMDSEEVNYVKRAQKDLERSDLFIMLLENVSYKLTPYKFFVKIRELLGYWCKVKYVRQNHLAYLGFSTEEAREKGITILQGFKLKRRNLVCTAITPEFNPFNPNHAEFLQRTYLSDNEDENKDSKDNNDEEGSDDSDDDDDNKDSTEKKNVKMETVLLKTGERVTRPAEDKTNYYHYLETGEYTSENYKIVVQNIPKFCTHGRLRDTLKKALGFNPKKIKYDMKQNFAFLACKDEDDRQRAIESLNKFYWKGRYLKCKMAPPNKDPYLVGKKRRLEREQKERERKKAKTDGTVEEEKPPEDRIVDVVCPYAKYDYEEQLRRKQEEMVNVVKKLTEVMHNEEITKDWKYYTSNQPVVKLLPIIRSPVTTEYRNKVEFTIGVGPDEKDNTVGFRIGSYTEGNLMIVEPTKCINCTKEAIILAKEFQEFIRTLPYPSFDTSKRRGFWQQLTIRTATTGQIMVIIQINRNFLSEEENEDLRKQFFTFYHRDNSEVEVTSVCIAASALNSNYLDLEFGIQNVCKESYIHEKMLGLTFRISPEAFFQVNTPAAEILYKTIYDWCDTEVEDVDNACIVDLCCGTGTIGLYLASKTGIQVKGIDSSKQAINDANFNASMNKVENVLYIANHAERAIISMMCKVKQKDVIAVVDPPRAGLHRKVINSLRFNEGIKKVIYVSCSARQAIDNWVMLCRPPSKRVVGVPFRMVRAVPVDLFPQTPHCELIVEFERINIYEEKLKKEQDNKMDTETNEETTVKNETEVSAEEVNTETKVEMGTGIKSEDTPEICTKMEVEAGAEKNNDDTEKKIERNSETSIQIKTEEQVEENIELNTGTNFEQNADLNLKIKIEEDTEIIEVDAETNKEANIAVNTETSTEQIE